MKDAEGTSTLVTPPKLTLNSIDSSGYGLSHANQRLQRSCGLGTASSW